MNDIVKSENQVPTSASDIDPYAAYGAAVASQAAPFLKFVKGVFQFGVDDEELPIGTKLIPNMEELKAGYIKWEDGEPVDENMCCISEGTRPTRDDCGDLDKNGWPIDPNGVTSDPWQLTNILPMKEPETGQEFVFTTGSHGGISAIGKLAGQYGRQRSDHKDQLPIIEIGTTSYRHKKYGEVHKPVFKLVNWASEEELISGKPDSNVVKLDDEIPFG